MNQITIPLYELDEDGSILPNLIFHRSWDKLHSRCIEYPFAASHLGDTKILLDVGTAKADRVWVNWLNSLPIQVHVTDYDPLEYSTNNIKFHQADVRQLDMLADDLFDTIFAVSVIEHIGLANPQVNRHITPLESIQGDEEAFCELLRVLKKGGRIVMTFPLGKQDGLILGSSARNYTVDTLKRFSTYADPVTLDYYEYQHVNFLEIYPEYQPKKSKLQTIYDLFFVKSKKKRKAFDKSPISGIVKWRRIPVEETQAMQIGHVDGVLCGVWAKR